jgi:hypothetical protein
VAASHRSVPVNGRGRCGAPSEEWRQPGRTITPVEEGLISQALYALDEAERCKRLLALERTEKARTAVIRYREACEDEVRYYVRMFNWPRGDARRAGGYRSHRRLPGAVAPDHPPTGPNHRLTGPKPLRRRSMAGRFVGTAIATQPPIVALRAAKRA